MKKYLQYIPFILILCIAGLLFVKVNQHGKNAGESLLGKSPMLGQQMPAEIVKTIIPEKGQLIRSDFEGQYSIVNLFASWCIACTHEHQFISRLNKVKGVKLIGVAWRDKKKATFKWLEQHGNPYDIVASDSTGRYGISLGVTGIPETYVIDPEGKIIMHFARPVTEDDVEVIIKQIDEGVRE